AQGATSGGRTLRVRSALLVAEVALSVMLMVGSGLLIRSLIQVQAQSPGFDEENLIAVSLDLPYSKYDGRVPQRAFYTALLDRVRQIPRVIAAVGTTEPPVIGFDNTFSFEIEGRPRPGPNPRQEPATLMPVTPGYFDALDIPLLAGRTFTERDRSDAPPVAMVNRTMAERLWPSGDAVGARVRRDEDQPWIEIVGVVGDTRHHGLEEPVRPAWYFPYEQAPWGWMSWMTLLVRTAGPDPLSHTRALEEAVWSLDRDLPIHRIGLIEDFYADTLARRRFITVLLGGFAALALVLGSIGLYGVLSYSVAGRTREFGVRLALGEAPRSVAAGVLRNGIGLTALGLLLGTAAALALSRFLRSMLWGVAPADPVTLAAVAGVLLCAAALACWLPARRATRADPILALRAP
ncbi:MAG TPA: ABC transporter permease, partial [Longimicrobiales bacterium]|nr:ABC transporter permease [Longimicrobiales bacterium]